MGFTKVALFFRRFHKWIALLIALPFLVIISTGILLSISPQLHWLQPHTPNLAPGISISFEQILKAAKTVPEAAIETWSDVLQVEARPEKGIVRVRAQNYWEIQISGQTGEVIGAAPRWKTLLITIHDGSWFSSWVRYGIFFPTGILAFVLWFTGLGIWLLSRARRSA